VTTVVRRLTDDDGTGESAVLADMHVSLRKTSANANRSMRSAKFDIVLLLQQQGDDTHVDGQVVELDNVETSLDTTLKVGDLLELVACESKASIASV
jgi:hypothetical protein